MLKKGDKEKINAFIYLKKSISEIFASLNLIFKISKFIQSLIQIGGGTKSYSYNVAINIFIM